MICEYCKKQHDSGYGSGRFCSASCARKFSNLKCFTYKKNEKISATLRSRSKEEILEASIKGIETYNNNHPDKKIHLIDKRCKICGQEECLNKQECNHMKRLNLEKFSSIMDLSKLGSISIYQEYENLKRYMFDMYITKKLSTPDIAKNLNVNWITIMLLIQKFEIHKRDRSESTINTFLTYPNRVKNHKGNQYHCGYHTSWEGKTFWYRSSYELDYAKELDSSKISYEVESIRILYWSTIYKRNKILVSDFYLPDTNTIVEVKSDFTYIEQDYKDRLAVLIPMGYNCKLLLEHQWYNIENIPHQKDGTTIADLD